MSGLALRFSSSSVSCAPAFASKRAGRFRAPLRSAALGLCALAISACGEKKDDTDGMGGAVTTEPSSSVTATMTMTTGTMPTATMTMTSMPTATMTMTTATMMPMPMPTPTMSTTDMPAMSTTATPMDSSAPTMSSSGGGDTDPPASSTSDGGAGGGGPSGTGGDGGSGQPVAGEFQLTVGAIAGHDNEDCSMDACGGCEQFPPDNVSICMGADTSPDISWTAGPDGTVAYAIILRDMANDLNHWGVWNIPGEVTSLPAGLASGAPTGDLQGAVQKSFSGEVYAGSGACDHVYEFRVYALTETLDDMNLNSVVTALDGGDAPQSFVRVRSMCMDPCNSPHIGTDCTP